MTEAPHSSQPGPMTTTLDEGSGGLYPFLGCTAGQYMTRVSLVLLKSGHIGAGQKDVRGRIGIAGREVGSLRNHSHIVSVVSNSVNQTLVVTLSSVESD